MFPLQSKFNSPSSLALGILLTQVTSITLPAAEVHLINIIQQPGQYIINLQITNPPTDGTYATAHFDFFKKLHEAGVNPTVNIKQDADPFAGWNAIFDANGVVNLSHAPFGFNVWDTETMAVGSTVATAELEKNGVPGHQGGLTLDDVIAGTWDPTAYDAIVVTSDNPLFTAPNYTGPVTPDELGAFTGTDQGEFNSWTGQASTYVVADPTHFSHPLSFADRHPGLDPLDDDNHNGLSNFLDDAAGSDPLSPQTTKALQFSGSQILMRTRINTTDVSPVLQYSHDLDSWLPLEAGTHYEILTETFVGFSQVKTIQLLIDPSTLFLRLEYP